MTHSRTESLNRNRSATNRAAESSASVVSNSDKFEGTSALSSFRKDTQDLISVRKNATKISFGWHSKHPAD